MSQPTSPTSSLALRGQDGRLAFELGCKETLDLLACQEYTRGTQRFIALEWEFEESVARERAQLLANPLAWTEEDQAFCNWVCQQYVKLAEMSLRIALLCARNADKGDPVIGYVATRALGHHGSAAKWELIARRALGKRNYAAIHSLYRLADKQGTLRTEQWVNRDGKLIACTLESLYLRSLLLGRFCSGNLSRMQIEILDSWLWAWLPQLILRRGIAGPGTLVVDPEGAGGIEFGPMPGESLFLPVAVLERLLDSVRAGFHAGTIFPGYGVAAGFRIEEHIVVMDYLRGIVAQAGRGASAQRAGRVAAGSVDVEVRVGLSEILRAPPGVSVAIADLDAGVEGLAPPVDARGTAGGTSEYLRRRLFRLHDRSDSGVGIEAPAAECSEFAVGDLVSVVLPDETEPALGEVVRLVPAAVEGRVLLGIRLGFPNAQPVTQHLVAQHRTMQALYVPGPDSSGQRDMLIGADTLMQQDGISEIACGGKVFEVRVNRQRMKGRGWVGAGFEILGVRDGVIAPQTQAPRTRAVAATRSDFELI